jgi:hypothetical protein
MMQHALNVHHGSNRAILTVCRSLPIYPGCSGQQPEMAPVRAVGSPIRLFEVLVEMMVTGQDQHHQLERPAAIEAIDKIRQEMEVIAPTQAKRVAILSMRY